MDVWALVLRRGFGVASLDLALWAGGSHGLFRIDHDGVRSYTAADGLPAAPLGLSLGMRTEAMLMRPNVA